MYKNVLRYLPLLAILAIAFAPEGLMADVSKATEAINSHAKTLQSFLLEWPLRIVAIIGFLYGVWTSLQSHSAMPLVIYGGIALVAAFFPEIIEQLFPAK